MPRNVRNFWITVSVDGRASKVSTGPRSKEGGFKVSIQQRENGKISDQGVEVEGRVLPDGFLQICSCVVKDRKQVGETAILRTKR